VSGTGVWALGFCASVVALLLTILRPRR